MTVHRRAFLLAGLAGSAACLLASCASGVYQGSNRALSIAAGESGGFYLEFAQLLAGQVNDAESLLRCSVVATEGSVANLGLLAQWRVDLALALADVVLAAGSGAQPFAGPIALTALGRVYENYMQMVVRADSALHALRDLAGRPVSFGAAGSGAAVFGTRLLAATGLTCEVGHQPLADAVAGLGNGQLDAFLWSGGVPTPALVDLDRRVGIRLLPMDDALPTLSARYGDVYELAQIPAGAYRFVDDVPTVGVANLLVCAPSLPDDIAGAIVRVLVQRAAELVPQQTLGVQFLDPQALISTAGVPLHPGAAAMYRQLHG